MRKTFLAIWTLTILAAYPMVHAYEIETHRELNKSAATHSSTNDYLRGQLRLDKGIDTELLGTKIIDWIAAGGEYEDAGWRFLNHFHNPLRPWSEAGLNDSILKIPLTGMSSLLWAQLGELEQGWSYRDTKESFYLALTSTDPDLRDGALANTFLTLGHVIHLIEDAAAPAHTRNDAHWEAVVPGYEDWAYRNQSEDFFGGWLNNPVFPLMRLDTVADDTLAPIAHLWDTDQYNGTTPLTGTHIGIAEYTNANFLSDDTMFTDDLDLIDPHYFPYPSRANVELWTDTITVTHPEAGEAEQIQREYLRKTGQGELVNHLAAVSWLDYWYRLLFFPDYILPLPVGLDEACYYDQAQFLVPRAVGYSARLLDYFLRGRVETKEVALNGSRDQITARLKSATPGEAMGPGQAVIVAQYTPMDGSETIYQASAEAPISTSLPSTDYSEPYAFSFSSPIPADAQDLSFTLAYRGWLGAEEDAVVGRIIEMGQPYVFVVQDALITLFNPTEEKIEWDMDEFGEPGWIAAHVNETKWRYWNRTQTVTGRFISRNVSGTEAIVKITAKGVDLWHTTPVFYINGVRISKFNEAGYAVWEPGDTPEPPATWMIDEISSLRLFPYFSMEVQLTDGTLIVQRILTLDALPDQTTRKHYDQWMEVDEDGEPITWEIFYRDAYRETYTDLRVTPESEDGLLVTLANGESLRLTLGEQFDGPFDFMEDEVIPGGGKLDDVPFLDYLPVSEALPSFVRRYSEKELEFLGGVGISPEYTITWSAPQ